MIQIDTERDLQQFILDSRKDSEADRQQMSVYASRCRAYVVGAQWIQMRQAPGGGYQRLTRQLTDWVGRNGPIRATVNRTSKYIMQIAAATNPSRLDVDCETTDRATDVTDTETADIVESIANVAIDQSGLLDTARISNFERTVAGDHGIGLSLEHRRMSVPTPDGEVVVRGAKLKTFDFDASRLSLDPHNRNRDLREHDWLIYTDVWTTHRMQRNFPKWILDKIDEKKLNEVGKLMPVEIEFHALSGGSLYQEYAQYSRTKGALIHFVHPRGVDGEWHQMLIGVQVGDKIHWVNEEDPTSPFGGDGLPYIMLRGHSRPSSRRSISDCGMLIDDQDKLNLIASLYLQQMWNYTGQGKWLVDKNWMGAQQGDDHEIIDRFNTHNVILTTRAGGNAKPPSYVPMPEPSQTLEMAMGRQEDAMREQAFRSEAHQGRLKTHVPTRNAQLSVELSEMPLDDRVQSDVLQYEKFIAMMTGTAIKEVQSANPVVLASLTKAGFGQVEFSRIVAMDPNDPPATIKLRQQAIRHRSRSNRRQDIFDLMQLQGIDPGTARRILANELDMPVSQLDKQIGRFCRQMAEAVMLGAEFVPLPLTEHSETMIEELKRAMTSSRAQQIPGAIERLAMGIEMQRQKMLEDAGMMEPQAPAEPGPEDSATLGELLGVA